MGKIFEALDKTGSAGEILQDLRDANHVAAIDAEVTAPLSRLADVSPSLHGGTLNGIEKEPGTQIAPYRVVSLRVNGKSPVLPFEEASQASEQYRVLRTKIAQHPRYPRTIVISSAVPRDGKSVTALNFAGVLSLKGDSRVLLIDADFRHPSIWRLLGLEETPGFGEVIEGTAQLQEAIIQTREYPNLFVLPAGKPESNPSELLDSDRFTGLLGRLKLMFKYVIIDSPPIATVADYDLLAAVSDGVIVVIRPDHTSRQACKKALETVPKERLLGVVMNCVPDWFLCRAHGYGAYY